MSEPNTPPAYNPVGWFEIPAADILRAKAYYEATLGYELALHDMPQPDGSGTLKMAWFPMNPEAKGATGSLIEIADFKPANPGTMVYFSCEDLPAACERGEAAGGKTISPETSIGEHGFVAFLEDTEGNQFGIHRPAQSVS